MHHCHFSRSTLAKTFLKKEKLNMNRMFSLNDVSTEFAVEELEPRLEMQMLGVGTDPGIIFTPASTIIIVISSPTAITII